MERLRAPGGCPWDREQTFDSIKPYTLEETYEVLEAIDNRDWDELPGELGDLLLQVLFYTEMAKEQGSFSIDDVLDRLSSKLVDRHPHVFGDVKAETSAEVKRNWEALKGEERKKRQSDVGEKGTDERSAESQETVELREQLKDFPEPGPRPQGHGMAGAGRQQIPELLQASLEEEVGDLFFVMVNLARYLSLDPESALRKTNRKFKRRFQWMEKRLSETGRTAVQATMEELESLWQQAKLQEKQL